MNPKLDQELDRIWKLLDTGLEEMRKGDHDTTIMCLQEALKSAQRLPQKQEVICLPDRSNEGNLS